jgi:hypothetical protein
VKTYRNHADVAPEVEAAAQWYEAREAGLGIDFVFAVEAAVAQICDAPLAWPMWPGIDPMLAIRRFTMRRFPFAIAYVDLPEEIAVLAVAHAKRRPLYWLARARKP